MWLSCQGYVWCCLPHAAAHFPWRMWLSSVLMYTCFWSAHQPELKASWLSLACVRCLTQNITYPHFLGKYFRNKEFVFYGSNSISFLSACWTPVCRNKWREDRILQHHIQNFWREVFPKWHSLWNLIKQCNGFETFTFKTLTQFKTSSYHVFQTSKNISDSSRGKPKWRTELVIYKYFLPYPFTPTQEQLFLNKRLKLTQRNKRLSSVLSATWIASFPPVSRAMQSFLFRLISFISSLLLSNQNIIFSWSTSFNFGNSFSNY